MATGRGGGPASDGRPAVRRARRRRSPARTSPSSCGQRLGLGDDREEVRVRAPPRHDVLVQVLVDAGAGDAALVHAEVEAVAARHRAQHAHRLLGERADLGDLLVGRLVVRARCGGTGRPAGGRSCTGTGSAARRRCVPRATISASSSDISGAAQNGHVVAQRLGPGLDVRHPVRRPQALELVGHARRASRRRSARRPVDSSRVGSRVTRSPRPCPRARATRSRRGCGARRRRSARRSPAMPSRKRNDTVPAGAVLLARDEHAAAPSGWCGCGSSSACGRRCGRARRARPRACSCAMTSPR